MTASWALSPAQVLERADVAAYMRRARAAQAERLERERPALSRALRAAVRWARG
jgi:hypothetical protein